MHCFSLRLKPTGAHECCVSETVSLLERVEINPRWRCFG